MPAKRKSKAQQWERSEKKESFWRGQIGKWKASGQSVRAFCGEMDLSENSFYAWRRELSIRDREQTASRIGGSAEQAPEQVRDSRGRLIPVRHRNIGAIGDSTGANCSNPFVPLSLVGEVSEPEETGLPPLMQAASPLAGIKVTTPNGFSISITSSKDVGLLSEVVKALEEKTC